MPTPFLSKSDLAYEELRRRILGGALEPGDVIGQTRIAAELGLSTTPLREALKRLAAEGLVVLGAHRDARVVELSAEEAQHLFEVRSAVDPITCSLAAERRTEEDLAAMERALAALEPLTGVATPDALQAHRAFHRAVYVAAGNPVLVGILDSIWDKADLYRQRALRARTPTRAERDRVHAQHGWLLEAIREGDAERAQELSRSHITGSLGRRAIGVLDADERT